MQFKKDKANESVPQGRTFLQPKGCAPLACQILKQVIRTCLREAVNPLMQAGCHKVGANRHFPRSTPAKPSDCDWNRHRTMDWKRHREMNCPATNRFARDGRKRAASRRVVGTSNVCKEFVGAQAPTALTTAPTNHMSRLPSYDTNSSRGERLAFLSLSFVASALIAMVAYDAS